MSEQETFPAEPGNEPAGLEESEPDTDLNKQEEIAFAVARLLCEKGWAAHTIAKQLYPKEYHSKEKKDQSTAIMRVKRAMKLAIKKGILKVSPPHHKKLMADLKDRYNKIEFTVVHDDPIPHAPNDNPVCLEAARQIAGEIQRLFIEKAPGQPIIVANAGGLTLSSVIHYLPAQAIVPEEAERLKFISLNAARKADKYQVSANFLAVRMAEIYGGNHIAALEQPPRRIEPDYEEAVRKTDLLISSAGTRNSFLFLWHKEEFEREDPDHVLPEEVVGDITFIPVDGDGYRVPLSRLLKEELETKLRPRPHYEDLLSLASRGKVLVVCARLPPTQCEPGADYGPTAKAKITRAILERGLASKCILGASVARGVLHGTEKAQTPRDTSQLLDS